MVPPLVIDGLPNEQYQDHPALSCSGAKLLLPPSCPAKFRWQQDNPPEPRDVFDIGTAAHTLVLGCGNPLRPIDADDWRGKAAREARDEARADGHTPLLRKDYDRVHAMASALACHPLATALLSNGKPEQSIFWADEETGVELRARIDWLPDVRDDMRMIVPDYKTAVSANPDDFARSAATFGYALQSSWYRAAVRAAGLDEDPAFVYVVQEKDPPYLVSVVELDATADRIGDQQMRRTIDTYHDCAAKDFWPGYSPDVSLVSLPRWYELKADEAA